MFNHGAEKTTDHPGAFGRVFAAFSGGWGNGPSPGAGDYVQPGEYYHQLFHLPKPGRGGGGAYRHFPEPGGRGAGGAPVSEIRPGDHGIFLSFPYSAFGAFQPGNALSAHGHQNHQPGGCHSGRGPARDGGNGAERCVRPGGRRLDQRV